MTNEQYTKQVETPYGIDVVCLENNKPIGWIMASSVLGYALITKHLVDRESRRMGVGGILLNEVENWAKKNGKKRIINVGFICDSTSPIAYIKSVLFYIGKGYKYYGPWVTKKL